MSTTYYDYEDCGVLVITAAKLKNRTMRIRTSSVSAIKATRRTHPLGDLVIYRRASIEGRGVSGSPRSLAAAIEPINANTVSTCSVFS